MTNFINLSDLINLPKDLISISISYLDIFEKTYIEGDWNLFSNRNICRIASQNGWLDLLKFIFSEDYKHNKLKICGQKNICTIAANNNQFDIIKWMHSTGHKIKNNVFDIAVQNNNLDVIYWAYENGYKQSKHFLMIGIVYNKIELIIWLMECDKRIDKYLICVDAIVCGQVDILKWLKIKYELEKDAENFIFTRANLRIAIKHCNLNVLIWLYENGCEIDYSCYDYAVNKRLYSNDDVVEWILTKLIQS